MKMLKKYVNDAFIAVTSLGTAYFYFLLVTFLLILGFTEIALHLAIGLWVCYIGVLIFRSFHFKERPLKEEYTNWFTKLNASSFPSLHTITFIFTATILSTIISKPLVVIFLYLLALLIAYSRIYLKKHHVIDVIAGIIIGIIVSGIYIYLL